MGVDVDQAGRHDRAADILDMAGPSGEVLANRGDPGVLDADVEHVVDAVTLVKHAAALQDEIEIWRDCR